MIIFGTGVVTGGLLVRHSQRVLPRSAIWPNAPAASRPHNVQPAVSGGARFEFLRRAERELRLSSDQQQQVDRILRNSQERIKKLMEGVSPAMRDEVQRAKEEFRNALTPQQRKRMDEMFKQQRGTREGSARPGHREKGPENSGRESPKRSAPVDSSSNRE